VTPAGAGWWISSLIGGRDARCLRSAPRRWTSTACAPCAAGSTPCGDPHAPPSARHSTPHRWQPQREISTRGRSMRSKIVPESLAERLALWAGKVPLPVVDTIFPLLKARCLMAAERLGIFEALRDAPLAATVLASKLGLDEESLRLLLG